MSDFNDAKADPAIGPLIRMAYSDVCLTDLTINLRADSHPNLLPSNEVLAKYTMNDIVIQESAMIKEAENTCWKLTQNIQMSTEIPSFKLSILSRYSGLDDHILAQIELTPVGLILDFASHDRRWSQVIRKLDNNDPALELAFRVVSVPSELSSNPSSANGNCLFDLPITNGQSRLHLLVNDLINSPTFLDHRGMQLMECFEQFGCEDDLQNAIYALGRSVSFTSDSDPDKPSCLNNLCGAFLNRFQLLGDSRDIDQAIKLGNDAVALANGDGDNQPNYFNNLSNCYARRFKFLGNQDDLNSAVSAAELAVSVSTEGNPRKPAFLYTLACRRSDRSERLGELDDINSAIEMGQLAFSLAAEGDELKAMALHTVTCSLHDRFERLGNSDDLEEAISKNRKAIDLIPEGFPRDFRMLHSLSGSLRERFQLFGDPADLDEAIVKGMDATDALPSRCLEKPGILNNVSGCFFRRFELNADFNDLTEAISLLQSAISDTTDGRFDKPGMLNNLGLFLDARFRNTNDPSDLDQAVSARWRAVDCTPNGDPDKPSCLMSFVESLQHRFEVHKRVDDLEESITCGTEALSLIPDGHPYKIEILAGLGASVARRFHVFKNPSDAYEATSLLKSAALSPTGPPFTRLQAALHWGGVRLIVDFPSTLEAIKLTVELYPRLAWTGKSIAERHRQLARVGDIVNQAAAYSLVLEYADTALEFLETGRAIVWSQLHNLRSPVEFLSDTHPGLAERLSQVGAALEKATSRDVNTEHFKELTMEETAREQRRLATEWDSLVERVRSLPGFEDFLGPKKLATLKNAAKLGPVILLNAYCSGCDALIVIPGLDDVIHIPLKNFSYNKAEMLQKRLSKSLSVLGVRTRASQPAYGTSNNDVFVKVLKELWLCIVKPVLDGLAFSPCDTSTPP